MFRTLSHALKASSFVVVLPVTALAQVTGDGSLLDPDAQQQQPDQQPQQPQPQQQPEQQPQQQQQQQQPGQQPQQQQPGEQMGENTIFEDWEKSCLPTDTGAQACSIRTNLVQDNNGTPQEIAAAQVTIRDNQPVMEIVLPLGIDTSVGTLVQVDDDGEERPLAISTCVQAGCMVVVRIEQGMFDELRDGSSLNLAFRNYGEENASSLAFSLSGFSQASDQLLAQFQN